MDGIEFRTQAEILEHLGKKNDRNLIKRMMRDGKIKKEDGFYYLIEENPDTKFISKAMGEKVLNEGEIKRLEDELYEAKEQWKYYEDVCESRRKLMEAIIHETYVITKAKLGNKMEDESDFRLAILERARESLRNSGNL